MHAYIAYYYNITYLINENTVRNHGIKYSFVFKQLDPRLKKKSYFR